MLVLSDEYQCARVSVIFQVFASFCIAKLVTGSIRRFNVLDIATDMQSTEGTLNPFIPVAPKNYVCDIALTKAIFMKKIFTEFKINFKLL